MRNPAQGVVRYLQGTHCTSTSHVLPLTSHLSPPDLHQVGTVQELGTDGPVVFIGTAGLGIGPRKSATHRRVVRLCMDGADVLQQKHTASAPHPSPPFAPASAVNQVGTMRLRDGGGLLVTQGDAVGAAGGAVRTGEAG